MPKRPFTFRCDDVCYAKIRKIAELDHRSMSNLLERLCCVEIENFEREHGQLQLAEEDLAE